MSDDPQPDRRLAGAPARVLALIEELVAHGEVRRGALAAVQLAPTPDKYVVASAPIDCASLIPLCKARCCRMSFPLSLQDVDEGVVRWDHASPFQVRVGSDGYCAHSDGETRGCGVYQHRPAICRSYDCRNDTRIWADFDNRIPAADDAIPLIQIRARPPRG